MADDDDDAVLRLDCVSRAEPSNVIVDVATELDCCKYKCINTLEHHNTIVHDAITLVEIYILYWLLLFENVLNLHLCTSTVAQETS